MLLRGLFAFLLLPGIVAYGVPLLLAPTVTGRDIWQWFGLVPLVAGTLLLLWCVRDFHVTGRGTLAPWSPPVNLVTTGLYARSRNPMYIAVTLVLLGWFIWYASPVLLAWALGVVAAFHLRIILYEEPRLARVFGEAWARYRERVPRWL